MPVPILVAALAAGGGARVLPVPDFAAVELAAEATLLVGPGRTASVVATGDPRLVRCLAASVGGGRLVLGWAGRSAAGGGGPAVDDGIVVAARANCPRRGDPRRLTIRVAAPAIAEVALRASGVIRVAPTQAAAFTASIPGKGMIAIDGLRADRTRLSIAGGGRIAATGDLGRLAISVAGDGGVDTRGARARAIDVSVAGHGDVRATADGPVTGSLAGAGTIAVSGHPDCRIRQPGGGRILCPAAS